MGEQQAQADVRALIAALDGHRHARCAQNRRPDRIVRHAFERLTLRVNMNRWTTSAPFDSDGEREMSALGLSGEHFAQNDF